MNTFVERVIEAAIDRLEYYQKGKYASTRNEEAIAHLQSALVLLKENKDIHYA